MKVLYKTCELKFSLKNLMHKHIRAAYSKIKEISVSVTLSSLASSQTIIFTSSVISVSFITTVTFITLTLIAYFISLTSSVILDNKNIYFKFSEFSKFISETNKIAEINKTFISDSNILSISDNSTIVISVYNDKDILETLKIASATSITFTVIPITYILLVIKLII